MQRPTMVDIRKIHTLLDEGDSTVAYLQSVVRDLHEAANLLGLTMLPFVNLSDLISKIRKPFHEMEQFLQAIEESSPYRYRNMSNGIIALRSSSSLKQRNIISLDEKETHQEPFKSLIDAGSLVLLEEEK